MGQQADIPSEYPRASRSRPAWYQGGSHGGALSSFVQSKPNFMPGQCVDKCLGSKWLCRKWWPGGGQKQSQSKPIFEVSPVAMDGRGVVGYNGQRCGLGAGAKDRLGLWECLR